MASSFSWPIAETTRSDCRAPDPTAGWESISLRTSPRSASNRMRSPLRKIFDAFTAPTTAGRPNSRATTAPCESRPPISVTTPASSGKYGVQPANGVGDGCSFSRVRFDSLRVSPSVHVDQLGARRRGCLPTSVACVMRISPSRMRWASVSKSSMIRAGPMATPSLTTVPLMDSAFGSKSSDSGLIWVEKHED